MTSPHTDDADALTALPQPARVSKKRALTAGAVVIGVLALVFVVAYAPRYSARAALEDKAKGSEHAPRRVHVVKPKAVASDRALVLPGAVQPLEETVLYPRTSGYVKSWSADIGDVVKEGQVLAVIDSPEVDQELEQARAQLAQAQAALVQAKANRDFSKTMLVRQKQLNDRGLAAPQDLDQRQAQATVDEANVGVAEANVSAQQANIARLTQLRGFERVTAPFNGRITARFIERGTLVSAGNSSRLFRIAAADPVRVFVEVPQDVAPSVKVDVPADVRVREFPARSFAGKIARASGELDASSRTMTTEVRVPNGDGALIPGMYAEVALTLPTPHQVLELPATALMNDAQGLRVATVGADGTIKLAPVVLERDAGSTILVAHGVGEDDRVVTLAGADLVDGVHVEIARD